MKKYIFIVLFTITIASILYIKMPFTVVEGTTDNITKIEIYGDAKREVTDVAEIDMILNEFHKTKYIRDKVIRNGEGTRQQYLVKLWSGQQLIQWINIADSNSIDVNQWLYHPEEPLDLVVFQ